MHVVHVVGSLESGGVQKLVLGLATTSPLDTYRHSVVCLTSMEGDLRDEMRAKLDVELCPFVWPEAMPVRSFRLLKAARRAGLAAFPIRFAVLLRRMRATIVHTHLSERIDLQAAGCKLARLPLVWTIHGLYEPAGEKKAQWLRAIRDGRRHGLQITADSSPLSQDFVQRGIGTPDMVEVVHAGADVSTFRTPRAREAGWRARWSIPDDALVIGTSGRLSPAKGHDVLIRAAALAAKRNPRIHVAIAGSGLWKEHLENEIAEVSAQSHVHMLGFQSDVPAFLCELDAFVLPSRSEGFPLALIEALAAGKPCIAADVGGVAEMLGADGGMIVPPENPPALADALVAMADPAVRTRFAGRGLEIASRYSYEQCAGEFDAIYRGFSNTK